MFRVMTVKLICTHSFKKMVGKCSDRASQQFSTTSASKNVQYVGILEFLVITLHWC